MSLEVVLSVGCAVVLLAGAGLWMVRNRRARERRDHGRLQAAREEGLHLPLSIHPVFNADLCIGSLACVAACPEGDVIGIVNGVGTLLVGANCVGHGRCAAQCPVGAIQLVYGTSERGVDIPRVTPNFESNVPGIYIAGELGGMGLIRNAARQGVQACRHALANLPRERGAGGDAKRGAAGDAAKDTAKDTAKDAVGTAVGKTAKDAAGDAGIDDLIILGAGPAGFAAALTALEAGRRFRVIEQDSFGGTVSHYPRQKITLTETIELPLVGKVHKRVMRKEELLDLWLSIRRRHPFPVQEREQASDIVGTDGAFEVVTDRGRYRARKVLIAIGRRGTPANLGIAGEELPHVVYRLGDPEQYGGKTVLVVGGGDSAVEAACALGATGAQAILCHRGSAFNRAKVVNRELVARAVEAGTVRLRLERRPAQIQADGVWLEDAAGNRELLPCDFVLVCIGGHLPTGLLSRVGIETVRHYGGA